jgi:hypothetical protein
MPKKSSAPVAPSLDNIKPDLTEYGKLRMQMKQIEARLKELDERIRPIIAERGKLVYDGYAFNCKAVAGRKTLDKEAVGAFLAEHGTKLEDFEKVGAPYTTLSVEQLTTI